MKVHGCRVYTVSSGVAGLASNSVGSAINETSQGSPSVREVGRVSGLGYGDLSRGGGSTEFLIVASVFGDSTGADDCWSRPGDDKLTSSS